MPLVWTYTLHGSGQDQTQAIGIADLELDPLANDIKLPPRIIRGPEAVAQRVRVRFRWFLGEWFLDTRQGVPYYRDILVKNPDKILISFIFRQVLTTTPGVKSVSRFNASLDAVNRELITDFEATLTDGNILTAQAEPFIIG